MLLTMSLASRRAVHFLRRSSMEGVAVQYAISVARHRCLSSAPPGNRIPSAADLAPSAGTTAVKVIDTKAGGGLATEQDSVKLDACGTIEEDEDEEMEEMLQEGPAGKEWGGPTRGGVLGEPTRFGDWERKGRCSDF